jgi:hypothetical protein
MNEAAQIIFALAGLAFGVGCGVAVIINATRQG